MNEKHLEYLGGPDIKIHGLEIWVHGLQFPDSNDYWDANWLRATARCVADGARVLVSGPIIHLSEIDGWVGGLVALNKSLKGEAHLDCIEPELSVSIKAESLGSLVMEVKITPNHLEQEHRFIFNIDQSYLPDLISSCKKTLEKYPIKGSKK